MSHVLVVSPDRRFGHAVQEALPAGTATAVLASGRDQALALFRAAPVRGVVVDLAAMAPQTVADLVDASGAVPVVVFPALSGMSDLLAVVFGTSAPAPEVPSDELTIGDLTIDRVAWEVRLAGQVIHLTSREFRLLDAMARRIGQALTREVLIDRAFGQDFDSTERMVDVTICRLRRSLLNQPACPVAIKAVFGNGYRMVYKDPADSAVAP